MTKKLKVYEFNSITRTPNWAIVLSFLWVFFFIYELMIAPSFGLPYFFIFSGQFEPGIIALISILLWAISFYLVSIQKQFCPKSNNYCDLSNRNQLFIDFSKLNKDGSRDLSRRPIIALVEFYDAICKENNHSFIVCKVINHKKSWPINHSMTNNRLKIAKRFDELNDIESEALKYIV